MIHHRMEIGIRLQKWLRSYVIAENKSMTLDEWFISIQVMGAFITTPQFWGRFLIFQGRIATTCVISTEIVSNQIIH